MLIIIGIVLIIVVLIILIVLYYKFVSLDGYEITKEWNNYIREERNKQNRKYNMSNPENNPNKEIRNFDRDIKLNHDKILYEVQKLMTTYQGLPMAELDQTQKTFLEGKTQWSPIWVKFFGSYSGVAHKLPTLKAITEKYSSLLSLLHVSVFKPGTYLKPHTGISMGVWRYHYGLDIPSEGNLGMVINGEKYKWKNGESILWDDTLVHSSWNYSDKVRLVIFADIYRDFSGYKNILNRYVHKKLQLSLHVKAVTEKIKRDGKSTS